MLKIFKLYEIALPGEKVEIEIVIDGDGIDDAENVNSFIDELCLTSSGKLYLFLINRSVDKTVTLELEKFKELNLLEYLKGTDVEGEFISCKENAIQKNKLVLHPMSVVCAHGAHNMEGED